MCSSSNDAFSNQHTLIPPSFGGPQLHVALPRPADTESATTSSRDDSQSTTRTVVSNDTDVCSELVAEVGHDVVKDLVSDDVSCRRPDDLMSAAEETSMSAEGTGFDEAVRRASVSETAETCSTQRSFDSEYIDATLAGDVGGFHNGHTVCSAAWQRLDPSLSKVASDSSVASSIGSLLESSGMDISGLVYRTAAVAGHSSFKTHAMTEQSLNFDDSLCDVDDSNAALTDKTDDDDNDDDIAANQHISTKLNVTDPDNTSALN